MKTNIYLQAEWQKDMLEQIARENGMVWGGKPNASRLIQAIANRQLELMPVPPKGQFAESVEKLIEDRCPFELAYSRSDGTVERHEVLYAEVVRRGTGDVTTPGGHWYLECYCPESIAGAQIPELSHNRTFRLDKLAGAVAVPLDRAWREEGLDRIDVAIDLFGGLAHNYEPQAGRDVEGEDRWIDGSTRRVVWRVSSYFWSRRYLLRYGSGCRVVHPTSYRNAFALEVREICEMYSSSPSGAPAD